MTSIQKLLGSNPASWILDIFSLRFISKSYMSNYTVDNNSIVAHIRFISKSYMSNYTVVVYSKMASSLRGGLSTITGTSGLDWWTDMLCAKSHSNETSLSCKFSYDALYSLSTWKHNFSV